MVKIKHCITFLLFCCCTSILALNNRDIRSEIVVLNPTVDFTFNNNVCSGSVVSFNSTVTGNGSLSYSWDFGDPGSGASNTSILQNPNHTFQAFGCGFQDFNVTLTVTDDDGPTEVSRLVRVKRRPNISFEETGLEFGNDFENCNAATIDYVVSVDNTSISDSCVTSYSINWGDGGSESSVSFPIAHTYVTLGSFNMVITAAGANGCQSQITYIVKNSSNPTGGIVTPGSTVDLCTPISPLDFAISNWGLNPPDTIYNINFGDGTTFTLTQSVLEASVYYNSSNPADSEDYPIPHVYTESNCPNAFYTVLLDIITSCGTSNLTAGPITILEKPEVSFDVADSGCINTIIPINNTSTTGYNPGCNTDANWYWDMGDGTIYTDFEPAHSYTSFGNYTISLYAENYCGDTAPVTQEICVEGPLNPTFTTNAIEGCAPFGVNTSNTTDESVSCDETVYLWTVTYTADFCGTAPGDWSFTGGTDEESPNPSFNFEEPGIYTLSLTASNSCGAFMTSEEIIVKAPPSASINPIDNECGASAISPVAVVDTCAPSAESISYNWSFPGGTPAASNDLNPGAINYSTNGDYEITFSVTTSCGTTTVTEAFSINESPTITNTDLTQEICSGNNTTAIVLTSNSSATTYTWVATAEPGISGFDASGSTDVIGVQTLINSNSTSGIVTYTVTPAIGTCEGDVVEFIITVNPAPNLVDIPMSSSICLNGDAPDLMVSYTSSSDTPTYTWYSYPEGDPSNITEVGSDLPTFDPPTDAVGVIFYYCVISFSGTGSCSEIETVPVSVTVVENVAIDNEPTSEIICVGGTASALIIELNGSGAGAITYQWFSNTTDSNTGGTEISGATGLTYTPPVLNTADIYYYYAVLDVDESLGCSDVFSDVYLVEVVDDPIVNITPPEPQELCQDAPANSLTAEVSGGIGTDYSYQWYSNTTDSNTGGTPVGDGTATFTPPTGTVGITYYYCEVSQPTIISCAGTSTTVCITVNEGPSFVDTPESSSICLNGDVTDLEVSFTNATGAPTYTWYSYPEGDPTNITEVGSDSSTFDPPTDVVGVLFYYCVISFSGTGSCSEIETVPVSVTVVENVAIDNTPTSEVICVGGTASALIIELNGSGAGAITYQWYSNTTDSNTGGTEIPGATGLTYTPPVLNTADIYYYYAVLDVDESLGCSDVFSDVYLVEVVDDPLVNITPPEPQELCQDAPANTLTAEGSGGIGTDYSYQWYSNTTDSNTGGTPVGDQTATFTPPTGTVGITYYYCEVSQPTAISCVGTSTTVCITVNVGPSFVDIPLSETICLGDDLQALTVSVINGTAPTYQWYSNDTNDTDTPNMIPLPEGGNPVYTPPSDGVGILFYYCEVSFQSGGCDVIISEIVQITINQVPEISDYTETICSGNSFEYIPDDSSGDIVPDNTLYTWSAPVISPIGSILGATAQLIPIDTISQFLENTTVDPATVTYTILPVSGDCVGAEFEVEVIVNPSITVTPILENNSCFESMDASIEITIVGGVPFATGDLYNITWTGPSGYTSSDEDIFNLEAGTYLLEIEDNGGCPYSETFIIEEPEILSFESTSFDPETISCFGANDGEISIAILGGTTPYSFTWTQDGLPFSTDEDLIDLGPGNYTVTITDFNNCDPITESFLIIEPDLLEANLIAKTDILCFGDATGDITISPVGGRPDYAFSWTGPGGFTSVNQDLNGLLAGVYTLTLTDRSGCINTLEVEIIQNDEIAIDVTITEIVCYGDNDASITINDISGGVPPYGIAWSNFGTGFSQTDLSAGTYTITITDSEDCVKDFPIVIDEAPLFLIDPVVTQISCADEDDASITLNFVGGIAPVTVVWDDDPTAGTERNNLSPGTYAVTITDGTPCVIEDSFTIFDIAPLFISANVTDALDCDETNSGAINLLIEGGMPPYFVVWSNGATTEDLNNIPPNNYTAQITDSNGCEIEGSWDVNRFEPLLLNVETQSEVDCEMHTVVQTFVAMASGGVPPFEFNWSSGTVSGLNNELMTTEENGLVTLEVLDSQGCTTNYSFNVETPVLGDPNFSTTSVGAVNYGVYAIQDPIQFTNEATGDYLSILWDFGDGQFSAEENPTHTYLSIGNYVITQTVTYPFGCLYTHIVTLIVEKGYKLIMPDAFSPNEDGINDFFGPVYIGLNNLELNIYDTWGSLVYSESGDDIRGWDGKIKDQEAENGNFYYTFSARTFYEDVIKKDGAFVFIK